MKKAKISELKDGLSAYLRAVREGESVLVYDRDRAIARIEPVRPGDGEHVADWAAELERLGILRAPAHALPSSWLEQRPSARGDVVAALLDERESGR